MEVVRNGFFVGTYHLPDLSPTPNSLFDGFGNSTTTLFNVHSHPGFNRNDKDWGDGVLKDKYNQLYGGVAGDYVNIQHRSSSYPYYVYYPNWGGLYQYSKNKPRVPITNTQTGGSLSKINN